MGHRDWENFGKLIFLGPEPEKSVLQLCAVSASGALFLFWARQSRSSTQLCVSCRKRAFAPLKRLPVWLRFRKLLHVFSVLWCALMIVRS